jgi:hypothetical protein
MPQMRVHRLLSLDATAHDGSALKPWRVSGRPFRLPLDPRNANPVFVRLIAVFLSSNQAVVLDVNLVSVRVVVEQNHM